MSAAAAPRADDRPVPHPPGARSLVAPRHSAPDLSLPDLVRRVITIMSMQERLASIRRLQERTYSRCTLCGEPSLAEWTLRNEGFVRLHGVIDDEVLISALEQHVSDVEQMACAHDAHGRVTAEHASGSLLPPTLEPNHRSDVLLNFDPPVVAALSAALIRSRLAFLLAACLGPDAILWELSALRSRPGAQAQPLHPDVVWRTAEPSAIVVWIALCDVTRDMGPTLFLPGTHTQQAHAAFQAAEDAGAPPGVAASVAAGAVGCEAGTAPLLRRGDALLMDSRVLHGGLGNSSKRARTLFYCTFRRAGDADAEWQQSSLRESLRDQHTLGGLVHALAGGSR